ncbi:MAG: hypothetical protein PHE09_15935 [Oscillospiraceae bacterium]|nr:hypothetical protein [Oscillospiraceae bacterium]
MKKLSATTMMNPMEMCMCYCMCACVGTPFFDKFSTIRIPD